MRAVGSGPRSATATTAGGTSTATGTAGTTRAAATSGRLRHSGHAAVLAHPIVLLLPLRRSAAAAEVRLSPP